MIESKRTGVKHKKLELKFQIPGRVLQNFYEDRADICLCVGPLGSGKTGTLLFKLLSLMKEQEPNVEGVRPTRFVVLRATFPELMSTTIKDFQEIFVEHGLAKITMSHPPRAVVQFAVGDGTVIKSDIIFLAADQDQDVRKIKGLQLSHGWINEASEIPKSIMDMLESRLGRYPSMALGGVRCSRSSIQMDSNSAGDDEYIHELWKNQDEYSGVNVYRQPGAAFYKNGKWEVNPEAENIENLPIGYYEKLIRAKRHDWIAVNVGNEWGNSYDGKPIFPEYAQHLHQCDDIDYIPGYPILLGIDFGLTPACVFAQEVEGQLRVFNELVEERAGALQLGRNIIKLINSEYPECHEYRGWGDPAGGQGSQTDLTTPFQVLESLHLGIVPAIAGRNPNDFMIRRESVAERLTRLTEDAFPRLVIGERCKVLRKAMSGAYCFKRVQSINQEGKYKDVPDKNKYSHIAEALQYLIVGNGGGIELLGSSSWNNEFEEAEKKAVGSWAWLNQI